VLRTLPYCEHPQLVELDNLLRSAVTQIYNVSLSDDPWTQSSLPVLSGGLGVRSVSKLASSAFLASAASTQSLQNIILHKCQVEEENSSALLLNWKSLPASERLVVTGPSPEYQPENVVHRSRKANFSITTVCEHRAISPSKIVGSSCSSRWRLALSGANHRTWTPPER